MKKFFGQLAVLLVIGGICLVVSGIAAMIAMEYGKSIGSEVVCMHLAQWSQTILLCILAPIWWAKRVYVDHPVAEGGCRSVWEALRMSSINWRFMVLTACLMTVSIPLSDFLDVAGMYLPWPDSVRQSCEQSFVHNQELYIQILKVSGVGGAIELFLLMCAATALGEEMLFRGALLNCFVRGGKFNWHVSIWIVGIIFGLIHFDMIGLFSRTILGAMLCYLVYWSGSLWPAILAHCMNNTYAFISFKMQTEEELLSLHREPMFSTFTIVCSALVSGIILWRMWQIGCSKEYISIEKTIEKD